MTPQRRIALLAVGAALAACSGQEAPASEATPEPTPTPPIAAPTGHADHPVGLAPMPPVPTGARVFFQAPMADMTVRGLPADGMIEVPVKMGVEGIAVKPAGAVEAGSGHHHVIVDGDATPREQIVPKDETHLHFGKGETEAVVPLAPGKHRLTMQFADGMHRSYGPELSSTIEITVEAETGTK